MPDMDWTPVRDNLKLMEMNKYRSQTRREFVIKEKGLLFKKYYVGLKIELENTIINKDIILELGRIDKFLGNGRLHRNKQLLDEVNKNVRVDRKNRMYYTKKNKHLIQEGLDALNSIIILLRLEES